MKKLLSVLLAVLLALSVVAFGEEMETFREGDFEYRLLDDGTAEIAHYWGDAADLEIPSEMGGVTVTAIGDDAFSRCNALVHIALPDGVTAIGGAAFFSCTSLVSIVIPDSVTRIDDFAFFSCRSLESVAIPDGVTIINDMTFAQCYSLESITLSEGLTTIGRGAFTACALASIVLPDSVTEISRDAFTGCTRLTLTVGHGSYAEEFVKKYDLAYTYPDADE